MAKKKVAKKAKPPEAKAPGRGPAMAKSVQPRTWRKMSKLAADALLALEAGDLKQVKHQLEALQAVANCADQIGN
jgi:hypothetical protein